MARGWFKERWTRIVPPPIERSTYVLLSSAALLLLFGLWRPMGGTVWSVDDAAGRMLLRGLFAFGFGLVLVCTFLIDHFDLFGLRQVWLPLVGRPYTRLDFATPGPYRLVRHPLYVGWFFAFWMTPTMTLAHLVFAVATTAYILIAIQFEERDLVREHGSVYEEYRRRVPMLIPFVRGSSNTQRESGLGGAHARPLPASASVRPPRARRGRGGDHHPLKRKRNAVTGSAATTRTAGGPALRAALAPDGPPGRPS